MCMCVCCLTSRSTPHLLHWFTPNLTPLTLQSHLLTDWQPTAPYRNSTHSQCPACEVAINPPAGLLAHWVAPVRWLTRVIFSSMRLFLPHPPPQGLLLHPCLSELLKCIHRLSSQSKKCTSHPGTLEWGDGVNQCRRRTNNQHRYAKKNIPDFDFLQVVNNFRNQ